jgi:hypothetical protein
MAFDDQEDTAFEISDPEPGTVEELGIGDELEPEQEELFVYDEDAENLVEAFEGHPDGIKALKDISAKVLEDFNECLDASEEYRERLANDLKLFSGDLPPKDWPFEHAANAHVPIMIENITRLSSRMESELFGSYKNVFGVVPTGPDDEEAADILSLHGNWQIRSEIDDFNRHMARGILSFLITNEVVFHSFQDEETNVPRHESLTPDTFYVPFTLTSTRIDFSDVPFVIKVLHRYQHDLERMRGKWANVDETLDKNPPSWDDEPESKLAQSGADSAKYVIPADTKNAPYKLLQYEGWVDMPSQETQRFVQVILDTQTRNILSLRIQEEDDWRDIARYERQVEELAAYQASMQDYQAALQSSYQMEEAARIGVMSDPTLDPMSREQAMMSIGGGEPPPPPAPPTWLEKGDVMEPSRIRRVPIRMFAHTVCIEQLEGSMGASYGRMQADFNRAANVALSQFTDSATLANAWGLVTTGEVEFERKFSFGPGKVNKVRGVSGTELKNNIMEMKPDPANPQLLQVVDKMYGYGQSSMQSPSVLSGEPGKSGETYRGISSRIEQATKQLGSITQRFSTAVKQVLINNAKLNSIFLDDEEMITLVDYRIAQLRTIKVGRDLYKRNYSVEFHSDLRFASEAQRISEADELVMLPQSVPQLQNNIPFIYAALKKALEARNRHDMVALLGPQPEPPTTPLGLPPPMPPPPPGMMPPGGDPNAPPGNAPPGAPGEQGPSPDAPPPAPEGPQPMS